MNTRDIASAIATSRRAVHGDMPSNAATVWLLLIAVFIDYAGVALVLPNLMFRWKDWSSRPRASGWPPPSTNSCAQLVGALIIGLETLGITATWGLHQTP